MTVLVPKLSNAGVSFPRLLFLKYEEFLRRLASGHTADDAEGSWQDGGQVYRDQHRRYSVIVSSARAVDVALQISQYVQKEFNQKAVYVEVSPIWCTEF